MEFIDVIYGRRMTRRFAPDPIDDTTLNSLLRAALRSPSAGFSQGIELLVLTTDESRTRFWEMISDAEWRADPGRSADLMAAPVIVLPLGNPHAYEERYRMPDKQGSSLANLDAAAWPVPYWTVDASFIAMSLLLGATNAGLGALFFQLQGHEDALGRVFGTPEESVPIGALAIGHPSRVRSARNPDSQRRKLDQVVHRERW